MYLSGYMHGSILYIWQIKLDCCNGNLCILTQERVCVLKIQRLSWTCLKDINKHVQLHPISDKRLGLKHPAPLVSDHACQYLTSLHSRRRGQLTCMVQRVQSCKGKLKDYLKKLSQRKISHRNGTDCNERFAQYHQQVLQFIFINLRLDAAGCTAKDYSKAERAKHNKESSLLICAILLGFLWPRIIESSVPAMTLLQMGWGHACWGDRWLQSFLPAAAFTTMRRCNANTTWTLARDMDPTHFFYFSIDTGTDHSNYHWNRTCQLRV